MVFSRGQNPVIAAARAQRAASQTASPVHATPLARAATTTPGYGAYGAASGSTAPPCPVSTEAAELARLFTDVRRVLGISRDDLARALATPVNTVAALETGHVDTLPPWPEVARVVTALLQPLRIDPRPVLQSLAHEIGSVHAASLRQSAGVGTFPPRPHAPQPVQQRPGSAAPTDSDDGRSAASSYRRLRAVLRAARPSNLRGVIARRAGPAVRSASRRVGARLRRKSSRRLLLIAGLPLLLLAVSWQSNVVAATTAVMPPPMARAVTRMHEYLRLQLAPVRDGLRWIEVDDPRSRRGDKLQTSRR